MRLLIRWAINTVLILALSYLLPDKVLVVGSITAALAAAVILGLINTFARPVFVLFSLPLSVVTLGLFVLVVNGIVIELLAWLIGESYDLGGFVWVIVLAVVISVLTTIVNVAVGGGDKPARAPRRR